MHSLEIKPITLQLLTPCPTRGATETLKVNSYDPTSVHEQSCLVCYKVVIHVFKNQIFGMQR